jgi:hypothetical protein
MDLRTTFKIESSPDKITYDDPVMFIGSCFATSIGSRLEMGHMPVMINPSGTVYNPVSVCNTLETILSGKKFLKDDLFYHDGTYLSFYHYTDFSSSDPEEVLEKINKKSAEAFSFFNSSRFLFITFGTARIYRLKKTGQIVSNCHKIPSSYFEPQLLSVNDIVSQWSQQLDRLYALFPLLKVIFTVSPIRHLKDGAHGNQISKSVLLLAIEELLDHPVRPRYFPAYELVMDDLRDYRFYNDDMLHLSGSAIDYIWEAFSGCFMDDKTINIYNEVVKITKACRHRFNNTSTEKIQHFAEMMIRQISAIEKKVHGLNFSSEMSYFNNILSK